MLFGFDSGFVSYSVVFHVMVLMHCNVHLFVMHIGNKTFMYL
jgi:hypothetical protein